MAPKAIVTVGRGGRHRTVPGGDTMDSVRITVHTAPKRRAEGAFEGPSDYSGRHVLWTPPETPHGVHPRGQGFRILSRLARAAHHTAA
jgi:hypothetical protein